MEQDDAIAILERVNSGMYHVSTDVFMRQLGEDVTQSVTITADIDAERAARAPSSPAGWTKATAGWIDTLQAPTDSA